MSNKFQTCDISTSLTDYKISSSTKGKLHYHLIRKLWNYYRRYKANLQTKGIVLNIQRHEYALTSSAYAHNLLHPNYLSIENRTNTHLTLFEWSYVSIGNLKLICFPLMMSIGIVHTKLNLFYTFVCYNMAAGRHVDAMCAQWYKRRRL